MATLIVNPSLDGYAGNFTDNSSFATIRAAAGNGSEYTSPPSRSGLLDGTSSGFQQLLRAILLFDTSALTAGATITAATIQLYITAHPDNLASAQSQNIVVSNPASTSAIADSDYNIARWDLTAQATAINNADMTTNAYSTWTLNATGLSNISKTGITKFGLTSVADITNTSPGAGANSADGRIAFQGRADANPPILTITYTTGGGDVGYGGFM